MITLLMIMTGVAQALSPMPPPKPSTTQMALYTAMKVRDPVPACEVLAQMSEDIATDLIWLVDNVQQPPWVGIRAAHCVVRHHADTKTDTIAAWMTDPHKTGLGILTLGLLDELSEATAVRFATAALLGPSAERARQGVVDSIHPAVRALSNTATADPAPTTTPLAQ